MKELSKITHDMSEHERADYLSNLKIKIIKITNTADKTISKIFQSIKNNSLSYQQKYIVLFAKQMNILKEYKNIGNTNITASFSTTNLRESIHKSAEIYGLLHTLFNLEKVIKYSIKIEEHKDINNDPNIKLIHEFISILNIYKNLLMVKITIKELYSSSENNTIYSVSSLEAIKKIENASHSMSEQFVQALSADAPLSTINLTLLFKHVNSPDI